MRSPSSRKAPANESSTLVREEDPHLEALTHVLDDWFRVPGTSWRFGLDPLIGLLPGVGDALTSVASFGLLIAAVRRRVPKIVIARMALNLAIDYAVGALPFVGDAFDFAWKANRRNLELLRARSPAPGDALTPASFGDYAFVGVIIGGLVALLLGAMAVAVFLLGQLFEAMAG